MISNRTIPAILCVGASLLLVGCNGGGGDGGGEPEAAAASNAAPAVSLAASEQPRRDPAVPKTIESGTREGLSATKTESKQSKPTTQPTIISDKHLVIAEPATLDLGDIPTGENKTGSVVLVNTGDRQMKLGKPKSSCGCTAVQQIAGKTIEPGESMDVEIRMKGGNATRKLNKTVTFIVEGQPPLVVKVNASAVSFVEVEPAVIGPDVTPDGKLTLRSVDGEPFRIINMLPAVLEADDFPAEPQSEFELTIPWDRFIEMGLRNKVVLDTDHPKCQKVYLNVTFDRNKYGSARPNQPTPIKPGVVAPSARAGGLIAMGDTDELMRLIAKGELNIESRDPTGATLLAQAAKAGNVDMVNALMEAGADIEATDKAGRVPLMAACEGKNANVIFALLQAGAALEARDNIGGTALSWAAAFGDSESVMALIDAGADINVVGMATGYTPLIWAAGFGEAGSIDMLLEAGADIETADLLEGLTPLMHAARTGKPESIRTLLENGADMTATDRVGRTPLLTAASNSGGTVEKLQILIEAGADVTVVDKRGENLLALAKRRTDGNSAAVVEYIESIMGDASE